MKTEKAFVAKKEGTVNGKIVFTHFNFVYIPNWGIINVKLGIIIVERRMVNQMFFSLQLNLEKPYATRLQLNSCLLYTSDAADD